MQTSSEALEVATRANDAALIAAAHHLLGFSYYWMGLFLMSRVESERAQEFSLVDGEPRPAFEMGGPWVLLPLSRALWMLGFPDQSRVQSLRLRELMKRTGHPVDFAVASAFSADVHYYCGELDAVEERVSSVESCLSRTESEQLHLIGWPTMLKGWLMAERGQPQAALGLVREGFDALNASRQRIAMPIFGCVMTNAQAKAGRVGEALQTVYQTIRIAQETGQHYSDAELERLRGQFLLTNGADGREAKTCFHSALDIARKQSAKSWELRATTSLARLLVKRGHREEARMMLAEICGWFTEGFDTADLRRARALLGELCS